MDEYHILNTEEVIALTVDEEFGDCEYEVFKAEIPRTRLKYYSEANKRWTNTQTYLEEVVEMARLDPDKVRRFK